jgi:hypothetical protein
MHNDRPYERPTKPTKPSAAPAPAAELLDTDLEETA